MVVLTCILSTGADLALAAGVGDTAPVYDVTGEVDPTSGAVVGTVEATLPVRPEVFEVHLRYFAGLPDFEAQAEVGPVAVDGGEAAVTQRGSIITVPLPEAHEDVVELPSRSATRSGRRSPLGCSTPSPGWAAQPRWDCSVGTRTS